MRFLDTAGCSVPSDRVVRAMTDHLRHEQEVGGYAAAPDLTPARAALLALVGHGPPADAPGVAFLESGTAAMGALLGGWRLPAGSVVGVTRGEYASTLMLLRHLARARGWRLAEIPVDGHARLDLDGLGAMLGRLDLVVLSHIASHRGVVQPVAEVGRLCRAAGVPCVLDVCQSLGHVPVGDAGATAYVGTSRKWLGGPRGVGFLIMPGPADAEMQAAVPALGGYTWPPDDDAGSRRAALLSADPVPLAGAARYETSETAVAARAGFQVAVLDHLRLGPEAVHARLAGLGAMARNILDGAGGWRAGEPPDEPSALVTLLPPPDTPDPEAAVEEARARAAEASLRIASVPVARAPADLATPVLRVSPPLGATEDDLRALARVLAARSHAVR
ncbi:pyridoxal 5-phosphate dependent beta-lyase [Thermocatellispora tengchongensis]|uniref:Pyridoxal 5-phosphate dependent beta-lyase n=1 Tax=Thermocatellispora tengchongensis TaxID=1073253 RepID=A0A840NRR0_9ACTN|nr:aminotransferase class V-fold PLP-dependent enzyme [Thermocatellispora tengchongensis]MBB5131324.1 pyridoxal 5-phosphate dependent beta-lyase [Thermocatellispora tengchongensis]